MLIFLLTLTMKYVISLSSAQNVRILHRSLFNSLQFIVVVSHNHHALLYSIAIKCSNNIEENPGLKRNSCDNLSICDLKLNGTLDTTS